MGLSETSAVTKDINIKEQKILILKEYIGFVLFSGFLLGFGFCICFVGILQQFEQEIIKFKTANGLLQKWWYQIDWWYWLVPSFGFCLLYLFVSKYSKKSIIKKALENDNM